MGDRLADIRARLEKCPQCGYETVISEITANGQPTNCFVCGKCGHMWGVYLDKNNKARTVTFEPFVRNAYNAEIETLPDGTRRVVRTWK